MTRSNPGAVRRLSTSAIGLVPYVMIPALSAVAPLLVIPAIAARFGAGTWTAVAIAQSLGGAASVIAELGWGVSGPQRVAATLPSRRFLIYRSALVSKVFASLVLAPAAAIATVLLTDASQWDAALIAVGTTLYALSTGWYFVGSGTPRYILYSDSLPRVITTSACAALIFLGAPLALYSWSTVLLPLLAVVISGIILGSRYMPQRRDLRGAVRTIRRQGVLAAGRAVSTIYTALPISIVAAAAPGAVTVYAGSERLMRMGLTFLAAFPNRLQSWIGSAENRSEREARSRRSLTYNAVLGLVAGGGFALLAPFVATVLYAGKIDIPFTVSGASGVLLAVICTSRGFGLAVVAHGRANSITTAIVLSAVTGLALLTPFSRWLGPAGAVAAIVAAEIVGVLVQAYFLRGRASGRSRASEAPTGVDGPEPVGSTNPD
jgi:O-antigen/teichoic acid export membrane protein